MPQVARLSPVLSASIAVWLMGGIGLLLIQSWLFEQSFLVSLMLGVLGPLAMLFSGVGLLAVCLLDRPARWGLAVGVVAAAAVLLILPFQSWGHFIWSYISLKQHQVAYESVIADARSLPPIGSRNGEPYRIDPGPPVRVYFPRAFGIPDGEGGVIHDPTGRVAEPGLFIFNSRIQSCTRIERAWYRCWLD